LDSLGLDTYIVNRDLSRFGSAARSRWNPVTHTFTVVTNSDGSIAHTYSWGNDANLKGWNLDQDLDLTTARAALDNNLAERVTDVIDDRCVAAAYDELNKSENNHINGVVYFNCKTETSKLMELAKAICKSWYESPIYYNYSLGDIFNAMPH
jgi:hypothetical protein